MIELAPGARAPDLSILVPLYAQEAFVQEALASVLAQRGVIAEILVSDDGSNDNTFAIARDFLQGQLADGRCPHRVLLRQGTQRLWRDHLPLLVEHAGCEIVMQAHGDDISHPDRAAIVCSVFRARPNASMIASEACRIDIDGRPLEAQHDPDPTQITVQGYTIDGVLQGHGRLLGYALAWRKPALDRFPRLDTARAPQGHDMIMGFRAALAGEVLLIRAQLLKRRDHALSGSRLMLTQPEAYRLFGGPLSRLSMLRAMAQDLDAAAACGLIDSVRRDDIAARIERLRARHLDVMLDGFHELVAARRTLLWFAEDEVALQRARETLRPEP